MSSLRSWTLRSIGTLGLVACCAGSVLGSGPVGAIVGTVLGEAEADEPIPVPGAAVWLFQREGSGQEFVAETDTNDKGFYAFESLPIGRYLLVVSADGFFPAAAGARVRPESEVHRDFLLVQVSAPPIGACCLGEPNGEPFCAMLSHDECAAEGGDYFGDDSTCDDPDLPCHNPPPPGEGACCLGDGCLILTGEHCELEGGEFLGGGTECTDDACADHPLKGACCLGDGCLILPGDLCELEGGEFLGGGTECTDHACTDRPLEGACCLPDGCHILTGEHCELEGGDFLGGGTECSDHACTDQPLEGACCLGEPNGEPFCAMLSHDDCAAEGGDYQGDGSSCDDPGNPC